MNVHVDKFFKQRCISTEMDMNGFIIGAVELIELTDAEINKLMHDNIDRLQHEPAWSIVHDMYKKCHEFTSSALATFIIAHIAPAEVLCRTAIESSVNLNYTCSGNDIENVSAYFHAYFNTEKKQNQTWLRSVESSNYAEEEKLHHKSLISGKEESLEYSRRLIKDSFSLIDIDFDNYQNSWGNSLQRFSKIGKEVDYRTIYASLCSQAHNDPEDLINNLLSRIIEIEGYGKGVETEQYIFSLNMVLTSVYFYIEASMKYCDKYNISSVKTLKPLYARAYKLIFDLQSQAGDKIKSGLKVPSN